jgi:predicted transcriptional regulator
MSYEIKRLLPRHIKVMDLKIAGFKQKEIAEKLDLTEAAVSSIVNSQVFLDHIPIRRAELQQQADDDYENEPEQIAGLLQRNTLQAVKNLVELLNSDNERLALAAAVAILDRTGHGKLSRGKMSVERETLHLSDEQAGLIHETLNMDSPINQGV